MLKKEVALAKQFAQEGRRDRAKLCLQKKKFQETLLQRAEQNLSNIDELIATIEWTKVQKNVFDGLKAGSQTLKALQKEVSYSPAFIVLIDE